jgi:hypothetical protein
MKTIPLIYDPRIKQNIPLKDNPNPALILLDILLKSPGILRSVNLEEIMTRCGKLADFCDERIKIEDDGK